MNSGTRYARIIDSGECYKSLSVIIDGVYANENTWKSYGFKPQDGMVGELLEYNNFYVLKVNTGIYIPISQYGFEVITSEEFEHYKGNVFSHDSRFPYMAPEHLDALIGREEFTPAYNKTGFAPKDFNAAIIDYCNNASDYIANMSDDIRPRIKSMTKHLINQEVEQYPYKSIIATFSSWIKEEMAKFNWLPDDYRGAAWLCSLYAEAYIKSLGDLADKSFKEVFSDLFKEYHDTL